MAISKIGSKALVDCSVAAVDIEDNSITSAKLAGSIANAKLANSSITVNGTSVSLGASGSIPAVSWQSVVTADGSTGTTAVAGNGYFIDTTSAAHTITLPSSPSAGDTIAIKDYAGTFNTNNLTIGRNGNNIQGVANDSQISTNRASIILVYSDATKGWLYTVESNVAVLGPQFITATGGTITTTGDYKIHTFTGDGCFVVSDGGNPVGSNTVDYLVVAGGGGGGRWYGGGGGAGGYRFSDGTASGCYSAGPAPLGASALPVSTTTYPITVGSGGVGGAISPSPAHATNGSNSVFSTITSAGGGGAGGNANPPFAPIYDANPGGSGGGGKANNCHTGTAGSGNTPPVSPPQGNPAGAASASPEIAAGGGGAGGASNPAVTDGSTGGFGGVGLTSCITGSPVGRGGGGSGNSATPPHGNANPTGAPFGGGVSNSPTTAGSSGTANTGGGGGAGPNGGCETFAGSGGKGIVIVRYKYQ